MKPRAALVLKGAAAGAAGGAASQLVLWAAYRFTGDASLWFKGPHGPPFFDLLVSTSLFFGCLGLGIFGSGRRLSGFKLGFGACFLAMLLPLWVGTRVFTWGEDPSAPPTWAWLNLVAGSYLSASAVTVALLGARRTQGPSRWKPVLGGIGGLVAAFLVGESVTRWLPSPLGKFIVGFAVSGAGVAAGIALTERPGEQPCPSKA